MTSHDDTVPESTNERSPGRLEESSLTGTQVSVDVPCAISTTSTKIESENLEENKQIPAGMNTATVTQGLLSFGEHSPFRMLDDAKVEVLRDGDLYSLDKISVRGVLHEVGKLVDTPKGRALLAGLEVHVHSKVKRVEFLCWLLERQANTKKQLVGYASTHTKLSPAGEDDGGDVSKAVSEAKPYIDAHKATQRARTVYHQRTPATDTLPSSPAAATRRTSRHGEDRDDPSSPSKSPPRSHRRHQHQHHHEHTHHGGGARAGSRSHDSRSHSRSSSPREHSHSRHQEQELTIVIKFPSPRHCRSRSRSR